LGVMVRTERTTPRLNGELLSENLLSRALNQRRKDVVFVFLVIFFLPFLTSCEIVGIIKKQE